MGTHAKSQRFNPDQAQVEIELGRLSKIFKEVEDPGKALGDVAQIKRAGLNNKFLTKADCEKIEGAANLITFRIAQEFYTDPEHLSKRINAAMSAYESAYKYFGKNNTAHETELGLAVLALLEMEAETNPDNAHTLTTFIWDKCSRKKDSPLWEAVNFTLLRMADMYITNNSNLEKAAKIVSDVLVVAEDDKNETLASAAKMVKLELAELQFHFDDGRSAAFDTVRAIWQDAPARSELRAAAKKIMTNWQAEHGTTEAAFEETLALDHP